MKKLYLLIADASLELVPPEIIRHSAVRSYARKRRKDPRHTILDISIHYHAMLKLKNFEKRGRPDIVHFCLLLALDSILNKMGLLKVIIHTINDKIIFIKSETRIPRNYNRFIGLMEQLLIKKKVPPNSKTPLMWIDENLNFNKLIKELNPSQIFLFEKHGKPESIRDVSKNIISLDYPMVIIGGFQSGDISNYILKTVDTVYSIYPESLSSWTVLCKLISSIENIIEDGV